MIVMGERLQRWKAPAVIAGVCLLCYINSLEGAFHYDDFHSIRDNPGVRTLKNVPAFFWDMSFFSSDSAKGMYRPLLLVTYALNYWVAGYGEWGYHLVNLLLHAICSILVWSVARRLLVDDSLAIVSGLVFALHPLATEPVNYISSRSELLAGSLYLSAFAAGVYADVAPRLRVYSCVLFALGLLSKATVITLPFALYFYGRFRVGSTHNSLVRLLIPYGLILLVYLVVIKWVGFLGKSLASPVRDGWTQLLTQSKAPAYYLKLLMMPVGQNVEHQFFEASAISGTTILGLALILSLVTLGWRGRVRIAGFATAWSLVVLLPTLAMPLNMLVNERRLYLVLAGLAWLVGELLRRPSGRWLLAGIPVLAVLSMSRNEVWADDMSLWTDAVKKAPAMYRTHTNLGRALQASGDAPGARAAYERAIEIDPRYGDVFNNMATLLHKQGRLDEAITWYQRAIKRFSDYEEIHQNLADAYSQKGLLDSAVSQYERALAIDDRKGEIWSNYGQTLYQAGESVEAEKAFYRALELLPGAPEPYNNLGNILADRHDFDRAVELYEKALAMKPEGVADVMSNLGDAYRRKGALVKARRTLEEAIAVDPDNAGHYERLGLVDRAAGNDSSALIYFEKAISLNPKSSKPRVELGEILAERGHHEAAIRSYRAALSLDSEYSRAWYGLGTALDETGELPQAIDAYRAFLRVWRHEDRRFDDVRRRVRELEDGEE